MPTAELRIAYEVQDGTLTVLTMLAHGVVGGRRNVVEVLARSHAVGVSFPSCVAATAVVGPVEIAPRL